MAKKELDLDKIGNNSSELGIENRGFPSVV